MKIKPTSIRFALILFITTVAGSFVKGQSNLDTITLRNGDAMVGEIKGMERAVLQIETDYSDKDFEIDWDEVTEIHTNSFFLINLSDGSRLNGTLRTDKTDSTKVYILTSSETRETSISNIVYIKSVKTDFFSRLSASVGIGLSIAKANNLRQVNARTALGYTANTWNCNAQYNTIFSAQDSVETTRRTDASVGAQWFLPRDWFISGSSTFLQNTEQKLKLRSTPQAGIGNYIVRNNDLIISLLGGLAYNIEKYETPEDDRSSLEGVIKGEANLFNTGDLTLNCTATAYPSITESGRFRSDISLDLKYEFPYDIYIKFGFTYNYDNKPIEGASESDYVFQWTIGWDL